MIARVTLKDIAREAGLSVMTVSQILNGKASHASPRNRELIHEIARRLNYQPNLNARRLVTRKTNIIGLLEDSMAPSFQFDVTRELETLITHAGYRLQIAMFHDDLNSITQYINDFQGNGLTSVFCFAHSYPSFGHEIPKMLENFERVVFLEKPLIQTKFRYVSPDHFYNFFTVTSKLLQSGRKRIINIRANYHDNAFFEARRGLHDAYVAAGIEYEECFWLDQPTDGDTREEATFNLESALPYRPDALILSNDSVVLQTYQVLKERGIRVPEDIALFSATQSSYANLVNPSISGIDYNASLLAKHLFKCMFQDAPVNVKPEMRNPVLPSVIVWRDSTGKMGQE